MSAEEALEKAKQIAAKLRGEDAGATGSTLSPGGGGGTKRKRWGVASTTPAATTTPSIPQMAMALPGLDTILAQQQQHLEEKVQRRIWLHPLVSRERPAAHFVEYIKPLVPDLIDKVLRDHGKSSNATTESATKKAKTTASAELLLTIALRGRGSSGHPALPGIPEEPLHVFIEGPAAMADQANDMVETVVEEAKVADVTVDITATEEQMQAHAAHNDQQLASYRPATVAQLIGQHNLDGVGVSLGGGGAGDLFEEELQVPNGVVGFIIGRGGETISSMQARTGAKVQIQKEHELQPGQTLRKITVSAPTPEGLEQCKTMIESMVADRVRAAGGSSHGHSNTNTNLPPKEAKIQEALDAGHALRQLDVPDADVGLIIGKGGQTIHGIQEQTGASVQIPTAANPEKPNMRTISITHPNAQGADAAAAMIQQVLETKRNNPQPQHQHASDGGGSGHYGGGAQVTIQVMIPDKDVGLCIGRQGCVIKEMQNKTGTRIQIPGQPTPGQPYRIATVSGTPERCDQVRQMIERIMVEQSSACVMTGTGGGGGFHQQQQQQGYPGQYGGGNFGGAQDGAGAGGGEGGDYSAEWAAYYAAQAVAQQQQQAAEVAAPAPAPTPAADAYYEQFFRYAYYYGEPAARQYYGAWSPPEGTPNPYGVNPDGVTAPPAAGTAEGAPPAAAAAPAPAPTPVSAADIPSNIRDSSVRKVSNLPAWMTRAQGK